MYNDNCLMKTEYFKGECVMNIPKVNVLIKWGRNGFDGGMGFMRSEPRALDPR